MAERERGQPQTAQTFGDALQPIVLHNTKPQTKEIAATAMFGWAGFVTNLASG